MAGTLIKPFHHADKCIWRDVVSPSRQPGHTAENDGARSAGDPTTARRLIGKARPHKTASNHQHNLIKTTAQSAQTWRPGVGHAERKHGQRGFGGASQVFRAMKGQGRYRVLFELVLRAEAGAWGACGRVVGLITPIGMAVFLLYLSRGDQDQHYCVSPPPPPVSPLPMTLQYISRH